MRSSLHNTSTFWSDRSRANNWVIRCLEIWDKPQIVENDRSRYQIPKRNSSDPTAVGHYQIHSMRRLNERGRNRRSWQRLINLALPQKLSYQQMSRRLSVLPRLHQVAVKHCRARHWHSLSLSSNTETSTDTLSYVRARGSWGRASGTPKASNPSTKLNLWALRILRRLLRF